MKTQSSSSVSFRLIHSRNCFLVSMERVSYHWNAVLRERVTPRAFSHLQTETWFFCQLIAIIYLNPSTTLIITTTLFYQHPVFNVLDIMNLAYSSRNRNSRISWLFFFPLLTVQKKCRRRCPFMDAGFVSYFKIVTFSRFHRSRWYNPTRHFLPPKFRHSKPRMWNISPSWGPATCPVQDTCLRQFFILNM